MKIAGVTILYYPDDSLYDRLLTYKNDLQKLIIINNTEKPDSAVLEKIKNDKQIQYIQDGENHGIAKRLNQAANLAIEENFDWLLTMDQDSFFDESMFSKYLECFSNFKGDVKNIAQFGVEYDQKYKPGDTCVHEHVSKLITSGSLLNLALYPAIGGFDEKLFIDLVDVEYCFRSEVKGYNNIQFHNVQLQHHIGNTSYHRSFKNFRTTPRALHSPLRLYYMTRNYLFVSASYKDYLKEEVDIIRASLFYHIKNNLLYNRKRLQVINQIFKGIMDFRAGKSGKSSN